MKHCPKCGFCMAYRGACWGCLRPTCTTEVPATPQELQRLVADVTRRPRPLAPRPERRAA